MSQTIQIDDIILYYGNHIKIPVWLFNDDLERFRRNEKENRILVRVEYPTTIEPNHTRQEIPINQFSFEIECHSLHEKGLVYSFGHQKVINHVIKEIIGGGVLLPRLMGEMVIHYRYGSKDHYEGHTTTNHTNLFVVSPVTPKVTIPL